MSLTAYVWGIRLFTIASFFAWLGVVLLVDPLQAGAMGRGIFAVSFFIFLVGACTLFVTWAYRKGLGEREAVHHLGGAFRQAMLLAILLFGLLLLQYFQMFVWWVGLLFFAAVLLVEFSCRQLFHRKDS